MIAERRGRKFGLRLSNNHRLSGLGEFSHTTSAFYSGSEYGLDENVRWTKEGELCMSVLSVSLKGVVSNEGPLQYALQDSGAIRVFQSLATYSFNASTRIRPNNAGQSSLLEGCRIDRVSQVRLSSTNFGSTQGTSKFSGEIIPGDQYAFVFNVTPEGAENILASASYTRKYVGETVQSSLILYVEQFFSAKQLFFNRTTSHHIDFWRFKSNALFNSENSAEVVARISLFNTPSYEMHQVGYSIKSKRTLTTSPKTNFEGDIEIMLSANLPSQEFDKKNTLSIEAAYQEGSGVGIKWRNRNEQDREANGQCRVDYRVQDDSTPSDEKFFSFMSKTVQITYNITADVGKPEISADIGGQIEISGAGIKQKGEINIGKFFSAKKEHYFTMEVGEGNKNIRIFRVGGKIEREMSSSDSPIMMPIFALLELDFNLKFDKNVDANLSLIPKLYGAIQNVGYTLAYENSTGGTHYGIAGGYEKTEDAIIVFLKYVMPSMFKPGELRDISGYLKMEKKTFSLTLGSTGSPELVANMTRDCTDGMGMCKLNIICEQKFVKSAFIPSLFKLDKEITFSPPELLFGLNEWVFTETITVQPWFENAQLYNVMKPRSSPNQQFLLTIVEPVSGFEFMLVYEKNDSDSKTYLTGLKLAMSDSKWIEIMLGGKFESIAKMENKLLLASDKFESLGSAEFKLEHNHEVDLPNKKISFKLKGEGKENEREYSAEINLSKEDRKYAAFLEIIGAKSSEYNQLKIDVKHELAENSLFGETRFSVDLNRESQMDLKCDYDPSHPSLNIEFSSSLFKIPTIAVHLMKEDNVYSGKITKEGNEVGNGILEYPLEKDTPSYRLEANFPKTDLLEECGTLSMLHIFKHASKDDAKSLETQFDAKCDDRAILKSELKGTFKNIWNLEVETNFATDRLKWKSFQFSLKRKSSTMSFEDFESKMKIEAEVTDKDTNAEIKYEVSSKLESQLEENIKNIKIGIKTSGNFFIPAPEKFEIEYKGDRSVTNKFQYYKKFVLNRWIDFESDFTLDSTSSNRDEIQHVISVSITPPQFLNIGTDTKQGKIEYNYGGKSWNHEIEASVVYLENELKANWKFEIDLSKDPWLNALLNINTPIGKYSTEVKLKNDVYRCDIKVSDKPGFIQNMPFLKSFSLEYTLGNAETNVKIIYWIIGESSTDELTIKTNAPVIFLRELGTQLPKIFLVIKLPETMKTLDTNEIQVSYESSNPESEISGPGPDKDLITARRYIVELSLGTKKYLVDQTFFVYLPSLRKLVNISSLFDLFKWVLQTKRHSAYLESKSFLKCKGDNYNLLILLSRNIGGDVPEDSFIPIRDARLFASGGKEGEKQFVVEYKIGYLPESDVSIKPKSIEFLLNFDIPIEAKFNRLNIAFNHSNEVVSNTVQTGIRFGFATVTFQFRKASYRGPSTYSHQIDALYDRQDARTIEFSYNNRKEQEDDDVEISRNIVLDLNSRTPGTRRFEISSQTAYCEQREHPTTYTLKIKTPTRDINLNSTINWMKDQEKISYYRIPVESFEAGLSTLFTRDEISGLHSFMVTATQDKTKDGNWTGFIKLSSSLLFKPIDIEITKRGEKLSSIELTSIVKYSSETRRHISSKLGWEIDRRKATIQYSVVHPASDVDISIAYNRYTESSSYLSSRFGLILLEYFILIILIFLL